MEEIVGGRTEKRSEACEPKYINLGSFALLTVVQILVLQLKILESLVTHILTSITDSGE